MGFIGVGAGAAIATENKVVSYYAILDDRAGTWTNPNRATFCPETILAVFTNTITIKTG